MRKEHNRFNLSCIIYSISLVLILFVVVPALQKLYADKVTAAWRKGYQDGLAVQRLPEVDAEEKE